MRDETKINIWYGLLILIGLLSFMPIANAQQSSLGTFKQTQCVNLIQTCADCTYNNITSIIYPNSTEALGQVSMDKLGTQYNYTFCSTNVSGVYTVNGKGDDGAVNSIWVYDFIITPTGSAYDSSSAMTTGIILALMFGVTIFFLIFSRATVNPGIQLFFNIVSYITMALTVGAAVILLQNSQVQSNLSNLVTGLMFIIGIVFGFIMFYIMIQQTKRAISLLKAKKGYGNIEDDEF